MTQREIEALAARYAAAWSSKNPAAVAALFAADGTVVVNRGEPWVGTARLTELAQGFYDDVPDLTVMCDMVRLAGDRAIFVWTFTGHDATTGNPLNIQGWEEWTLGNDGLIATSLGWFDAEDYARQAAGG